MWYERTEDIERGLRLIPRLGEVMPEEADEGTRRVYDGVRSRLRVPFVNFIFRVLANYPPYLRLSWERLEPFLLTAEFEEAADALRSRALLEPVPDSVEAAWGQPGDLQSIRAFTDTIHYVLPKLLLVASAFDEGLDGAPARGGAVPEPAVAPGVAEGTTSVPMVDPADADGDLGKTFEEIETLHGHPGVASYYRGIGHWPEFLSAVWGRLRPLVGSTPYENRKRGLLEHAREAVLELPLPNREEALDHGLQDGEISEIKAVLAVFRFRVIPDTFIEVALVKAMLDGADAARSSRFGFHAS